MMLALRELGAGDVAREFPADAEERLATVLRVVSLGVCVVGVLTPPTSAVAAIAAFVARFFSP